MPRAASSSAVPIIAAQSPGCTRRSRPGQTSPRRGRGSSRRESPPPAPGRRRSRAASPSRGASVPETTNSMPAASNGCAVCARHASTTDGAARSATSRIAPGPLSAATAPRSTSLASRATTRTFGLAFLASNAISRFVASSSPAQMTASGVGDLGVGEFGGRSASSTMRRAGAVELLDDRRRQRVVTADDDVLVHADERIAAKVICLAAARAIP